MTFAHLVASVYLATVLTRGRRPEASDLVATRVEFQNGPGHPVDDLLITFDKSAAQTTLAVACRTTPNFVNSDTETVKLIGSLLAEVETFNSDDHLVAVAAAGWKAQWDELARLCDIARAHADAGSFGASIGVDGRWTKQVRGRYDQFKLMVGSASGVTADATVAQLSWRLLSRLRVLGFRVQPPDEGDRSAVASMLDTVADSAVDGVGLRDRLERLAAGYDSRGAVVDLDLLRRDLHSLLDAAATRSRQAWQTLDEHRNVAVAGVRTAIGNDTSGGGPVTLPFDDRRARLGQALLDAGSNTSGLLVSGESGTGKSALTLSAVAELATADPAGFQAVILNFRNLPHSSVELSAALGIPVRRVLAEMSAPARLLVIDAADVALERSAGLLSDLVLSAHTAGVGVVAVSADAASDFVRDQLAVAFSHVAPFTMDPLGDEDIAAVSAAFPLLGPVLRDLAPTSLLRRPVVLDLLARTGVAPQTSLGEWECLDLIWAKVVRGDGRPHTGSAEARSQTVLAVAAAALQLPPDARPAAGIDPDAVDALRRDHLLAPPNPYRDEPEFAHDEVRKYATALLLVRASDPTWMLRATTVPRLALSAATLASKGALKAPGVDAPTRFLRLLAQYRGFATTHGARWADVAVEAALDTQTAYQCLKAALGDPGTGLVLADVVRVAQQHYQVGGFPDPNIGGGVVQLLLDHEKPWDVSKDSFEFLAGWLTALVFADTAAGHPIRISLRGRLQRYWDSFPPPTARAPETEDAAGGPGRRRRKRRRDLDYQQTSENLVETMALLGTDINDEVETCLRSIAEHAPAFLAPAADSPFSARAVAQRDPELLAALIEAYYIDDEHSWHHDEGVRPHQGRWTSIGGPFSQYYFGGFWALAHSAAITTQIRVLNAVLDSGANARVKTLSRLGVPDPFDLPMPAEDETKGDEGPSDDTFVEVSPGDLRGGGPSAGRVVLNLDGTDRVYVGDSHVWSWYRGTTVGPYSAMSGLLAMERAADNWLTIGASPRRVIDIVLAGSNNLATPGLLYGLLVRHLDKVDDELDFFLAEPLVWKLEFSRRTNEYSGLAFNTEGLINLDRRQWTPREVAAALLIGRGPERAAKLKRVGEKLIENGDRLGIDRELTLNWAASLDAERYRISEVPGGLQFEVEPPAEIIAAQAAFAAHQELVSTSLRLQNRYWGSAKHDASYVAPTSAEIAADLTTARELLETEDDELANRPVDTVAHVVRAAVERAVAGDLSALGEEAAFSADFVLSVANSFRDIADQRDEGFFFDLGADRAVAATLPSYLTPQLEASLRAADGDLEVVAQAGAVMAEKSSRETRLYLARGCDVVWAAPCTGKSCIHRVALDWILDTVRTAEIGPWNQEAQRREPVRITGDPIARLQTLPGDSVSISALDAAIRGLGAAASTTHCQTAAASQHLQRLLDTQGRAMVVHKEKGWSADDRGTHTLVTARALTQGYANDGDALPVLNHLDVLRAESSLLSNLLHGLAAVGAESDNLAGALRRLWPTVITHALRYADDGGHNPYRDHHWGDWAAAALLPEPLAWSQHMYSECKGPPIDWVNPDDLLRLIDPWLPVASGESKCVDQLIGLLRGLPMKTQVRQGLAWVSALCIQGTTVSVAQSWYLNDWLKGVRPTAEELGRLGEWQVFVDAVVVAGNQGLAPFSR